MRRAILSKIPALLVLAAIALFLLFPARYAASVREGISLWAASVLPAAFPFLFLTAIFTRQGPFRRLSRALSPAAGKCFRVSGAGGCAALLSAISGYPVGARSLSDLAARGLLPAEERFRLACLCSTTGPMFLVGAVGAGMYQSAAAGWVMLFSHLAAVWTTCFLLRFRGKPSRGLPPPAREGIDLSELLPEAVLSVLCVGGSIALFNAFGQMCSDALSLAGLKNAPVAEGVLRGMLEMTSGCALLAKAPSPLSLALSCFLVTFGGACVLLQQAVFLTKAGVKMLPFTLFKFAQGIAAAVICYPLALAAGV